MRPLSLRLGAAALIVLATSAGAQQRDRADRRPPADGSRVFTFSRPAADRAVLGITLGEAGTAGIRVAGVTENGPAARAGIRPGDHLTQVDGVDLRLAPGDADDPVMRDAAARRLVRALERIRAGDELPLEVRSGDATRAVRVQTVRADALEPERAATQGGFTIRTDRDRATLGLSVTTTGTARDTLGAFVASVVPGGPAERAGIFEGARITAVNGASMRVDPADVGDAVVGRARADRLQRELRDRRAGDEVTLRVWENGREREVRVRTAPASEVYADGVWGAWTGELGVPGLRVMPFDGAEFRRLLPRDGVIRLDSLPAEVRERVQRQLDEARERGRAAPLRTAGRRALI